MADQSISLFQSGPLKSRRDGFRSLQHHHRTEKFNSLTSPARKQPVVPMAGMGDSLFLCQGLSKSIIVWTVGHLLGFKAGSEGREREGGSNLLLLLLPPPLLPFEIVWLKHPLPGCLWERGHARLSPSAHFADSRWHLGSGGTSASLCQPCHSLSRFRRGRCHPGSRTWLCLPPAGSARAAPAPGRAGAAEQPQPSRSRRRPARQRGGLPWAPASFLLPHTRHTLLPPLPPAAAKLPPSPALGCVVHSFPNTAAR